MTTKSTPPRGYLGNPCLGLKKLVYRGYIEEFKFYADGSWNYAYGFRKRGVWARLKGKIVIDNGYALEYCPSCGAETIYGIPMCEDTDDK